MSKPETAFINSIHDQLPPESEFHREKMWNALRSGTVDTWYSGNRTDLWVEYKWITLPRRAETLIEVALSQQQKHWLKSRYAEGRNVAVILGFNIGARKYGVVFLHEAWQKSWLTSVCHERARSSKEIALWIQSRCLKGSYRHSVSPIAV